MKNVPIDSKVLENWEQFISNVTDIPSQVVSQVAPSVSAGTYGLPLVVS